MLASGSNPWRQASGDYASPFRGQGLAFHEVREYRFGDDIRSIDWRVTARTDKPHVKVFTEERERTVILCIDANAAMRFGTRGTFKSVQAARAAALLGWQANGSNDRVGCIVFGDVPGGMQFFAPTDHAPRPPLQGNERGARHAPHHARGRRTDGGAVGGGVGGGEGRGWRWSGAVAAHVPLSVPSSPGLSRRPRSCGTAVPRLKRGGRDKPGHDVQLAERAAAQNNC